ncbi:MAG: methyltransferase domain-containing protein [Endomicrobiales bacterium]|nr:methyltransferase domain-containing protein [Endomicrobiales bacterium]
MNRQKAWFRSWAKEYDNTLGKMNRHHTLIDAAVRASGVRKNDKVLDIGCGTGLLSMRFLRQADCLVTAVDSSNEMVRLFKEKIGKARLENSIRLEKQEADDLKFKDGSFDIAASTMVLHHLADKGKALKRIFRVLKPGGKFVIGELNLDSTGSHTDPERLLRMLNMLKYEYASALRDGGIQAFNRMYDNGRKHIFNDGEFCLSLRQWSALIRKAGFRNVKVRLLKGYPMFGVVSAVK